MMKKSIYKRVQYAMKLAAAFANEKTRANKRVFTMNNYSPGVQGCKTTVRAGGLLEGVRLEVIITSPFSRGSPARSSCRRGLQMWRSIRLPFHTVL